VSQQNVEIVRALFEAFDGSDLSSAADYLDPDIEWDNTVLIDEEVLHGRQAVVDYWQRILTSFPFVHEDHRIIDAGDQVCALVRIHAKGAGSGVESTAPCGYAVDLRDGMIVRMRFFRSQAKALEAVGLAG
jgi:ketosteroid isomerase-like protein